MWFKREAWGSKMGVWEVQNPGTDGGAQPNALSSIISQAMHVLHLSTIVHLLSMDNFSPEGTEVLRNLI